LNHQSGIFERYNVLVVVVVVLSRCCWCFTVC